MSEVAQLKEQAVRARRLASGVTDAVLARSFEEIAEEYEAMIEFLDRRSEPEGREVSNSRR